MSGNNTRARGHSPIRSYRANEKNIGAQGHSPIRSYRANEKT